MRLLFTVVLALLATFAPVASFAKTDMTTLAGYTILGLAPGFEAYLKDHPTVVEALAKDAEASRALFASTALQNKLMSGDITVSQIKNADYDFSEAASKNALDRAYNNAADSNADQALADATKTLSTSPETPQLTLGQTGRMVEEVKPEEDTTTPNTSIIVPPNNQSPPYVPPLPTAEPTPEAIDINSRPSLADLAPDANGWPKYLRAPANCAVKETGRNYTHEFVSYDFKRYGTGLPNAITKNDTIKNYFNSGGNPWEMYLNAKDTLAIPFVYMPANPDLNYGSFMNSHEASARRGMIWAISDCPNDFGTGLDLEGPNLSAEGNRLGKNCVIVAHGEWVLPFGHGNLNNHSVCKLEPNKRYFLNIKSYDGMGEFEPECLERKCYINGAGVGAGQMNSLPYAGPCYTAAPYPLNYNSRFCGQSFGQTCETASVNDATCYDLTGQKAPVRLVSSCETGTKEVWTEGFGKPLYATMMCEATGNTAPNGAVCAVHRKGQVKRAAVYNQQGDLVYEKVETCVFEGGRYFWKLTRGGGPANLAPRGLQVEHTLTDPDN